MSRPIHHETARGSMNIGRGKETLETQAKSFPDKIVHETTYGSGKNNEGHTTIHKDGSFQSHKSHTERGCGDSKTQGDGNKPDIIDKYFGDWINNGDM